MRVISDDVPGSLFDALFKGALFRQQCEENGYEWVAVSRKNEDVLAKNT